MGTERQLGTLGRFCLRPGQAHAYVHLKNKTTVYVRMADRGVLNPDKSIRSCINGERYHPLMQGQTIAVDLDMHPRQNPIPVLWAPTNPIKKKAGP